ncbi:hypothetical protein TeGR_g10793, partial [Tetraparma gracilis]
KMNIYNSLGIRSDYSSQADWEADFGPFPDGAAFPFDAAESEAKDSVTLALNLSYACFALDFLGMCGGFSLFFSRINLYQIIVHAIGGVYTSWFIAYGWKWQSIWYIVGFTNFTTAIVEIAMLFAIFVVKIVVY